MLRLSPAYSEKAIRYRSRASAYNVSPGPLARKKVILEERENANEPCELAAAASASGPGDTLYAEARERYIGRTTGYYQIDITNQDGKLIATFESSVFRKGDPLPFSV